MIATRTFAVTPRQQQRRRRRPGQKRSRAPFASPASTASTAVTASSFAITAIFVIMSCIAVVSAGGRIRRHGRATASATLNQWRVRPSGDCARTGKAPSAFIATSLQRRYAIESTDGTIVSKNLRREKNLTRLFQHATTRSSVSGSRILSPDINFPWGSPSRLFSTSMDEELDFSDLDYASIKGADAAETIETSRKYSTSGSAVGHMLEVDKNPEETTTLSNSKETNNAYESTGKIDEETSKQQSQIHKEAPSPQSNIKSYNEHDNQDPLFAGIKSRPLPNNQGNWNPHDPLSWTKSFGSRSPATASRLDTLTKLKPGDEGYSDVSKMNLNLPDVTVVRTKEEANVVMKKLMESKVNDPDRIHACDTEVMDIDLAQVGPVGNGYVTCISVYSGDDFDYGLGDGPGTVLWIDNLDDAHGILNCFTPWLEDPGVLKVWHNYGFDRHVLFNEGIDVLGFGGDTMHMARLSDTSRMKYSLESLTEDLLKQRKIPMKEIFGVKRLRKDGSEGAMVDLPNVETMQRDEKFREKWIAYSAYDAKGTYNLYQYLKVKLLKTPWIKNLNMFDYYHLHMRPFGELLTDLERRGMPVAKDYLADVERKAREDRQRHVDTFRQWAFEKIGPDGLAMNLASSVQLTTFLFGGATNAKTKEVTEKVRTFKTQREEIPDDAMEAYRERDSKLRQEMEENKNNGAPVGENGKEQEQITDEFDQMKAVQLKALCKEYGLKVSGKKGDLIERLRGHFLSASDGDVAHCTSLDEYDSMSLEDLSDVLKTRGLVVKGKETKSKVIKELRADDDLVREVSANFLINNANGDSSAIHQQISDILEKAMDNGENAVLKEIMQEIKAKNEEEPKYVDVTITSLGMEPDKFTASGAPSATADVLRKLAGDPFADPPKYGTAYDFFGRGEKGHNACVAFFSLTAIGSIDTMIANFLTSLQTLADEQNRVHCSLNLNTETGRLSSRKPNMQNQPALEKDKYKIRQAFIASPGNKLIVADYGQLELRLLASMTDCTSMIEAFEAGGDFHSRTALGMFKYIQDAVENGECLLEWDYENGDPPKPMLKDLYASERRKAKTLNFSIAYGKTAHGLSQDWGVSLKEAEEMLKAWYDSRPEVEKWQKDTKAVARKYGLTRTLMGRYRHLPHAKDKDRKRLGHAERASINTPIQGGAADVAMMAMLKINNSELLKRLGWILLMQVHDEVILEGPEETAEEAFEEVVKCMQKPWVLGLEKTKVPLLVDGSYVHNNWYDAK
mmetsp:Transcript_6377/g.13862  ORF Transcript_6377/g.13862 Transcript_6377/m.13862 type:complete len:1245 (-) Transcript_6377:289-4023(-)